MHQPIAAAPVPLKYGEIARIQRHFLTQIHVQVGPLVVISQCLKHTCVISQPVGPGKAARIVSWPMIVELGGPWRLPASLIADGKKGSKAVSAAQLLVGIGLDAPEIALK